MVGMIGVGMAALIARVVEVGIVVARQLRGHPGGADEDVLGHCVPVLHLVEFRHVQGFSLGTPLDGAVAVGVVGKIGAFAVDFSPQ